MYKRAWVNTWALVHSYKHGQKSLTIDFVCVILEAWKEVMYMTNITDTLYGVKAHLAIAADKIIEQLARENRVKCGGLEAIHSYKQAISYAEEALEEYSSMPEIAAVIAYMIAKRRSIHTAPYYAPVKPSLTTLAQDIHSNLLDVIEWVDYAHVKIAEQSCTTNQEV